MRYFFLICIGIIFSQNLIAQNQAAIWYLGNGNGVDFSKSPPEIIENAPTNTDRYATISDMDGNLVFYCNHNTVWNVDHQVMENGTGLEGSMWAEMIIIPRPGSETQYYIFQVSQANKISNSRVIYALIDVGANEGSGSVIQKNVMLYANLHGSITVSGNCESGYWLVGETNTNIILEIDTDRIYAFRIDENSVSKLPVISEPASMGNSYGYRFSPDGQKLFFGYGGNEQDKIVIADFNLETGVVSNLHDLGNCCGDGEFSAGGKFLYVTFWTSSGIQLRQYNLTLPGYPYLTIANIPNLSSPQLAADGKIYFLINNDQKMAVINKPDQPGLASDFVVDEIFPFSNQLQFSLLPESATHLLYRGSERIDAGPDVEVCSGEAIQIGGTNTPLNEFEWFPKAHLDNPNVSNPIFSYDNPYDSTLTLTYKIKSCDMDQLNIQVHPIPRPAIYGSRSVCPRVEQVDYWTDYQENYTYEWIVDGGDLVFGQGTDSIQVNWGPTNASAKVSLIVTNRFNCVSEEIVFNVRINVELETETPSGLQEICMNQRDNNLYQLLPTRGSIYTWEIEGGTITQGQGTNRVVVNWGGPGDNWIRVLEESVTIDTICFGESPKLAVTVFKDSLELQIDYVTVNPTNDTRIELFGEFINSGDGMHFPLKVFRKQIDESDWDTIFLGSSFSDSISFFDNDLSAKENVYKYYLQSTNGCHEDIHSNTHNTIRLGIKRNELNNTIRLMWNPYTGWPEGVKYYEVYRKIDLESKFTFIGTSPGSKTSFAVQNEKDGFSHSFLIKALVVSNKYYSWSNRVTIEFEHALFIPNVFTPNGDGINETFMIDPIHLYQENELVIINRWGDEVYKKKNYQGDWTGNGFAAGVYYYWLYVQRDQREYNGWVQILR